MTDFKDLYNVTTSEDNDDFLLRQKIKHWNSIAREAIKKSGGEPSAVLEKFPHNLLETLIRNDIFLTSGKLTR